MIATQTMLGLRRKLGTIVGRRAQFVTENEPRGYRNQQPPENGEFRSTNLGVRWFYRCALVLPHVDDVLSSYR
jgi:hypothetical protein